MILSELFEKTIIPNIDDVAEELNKLRDFVVTNGTWNATPRQVAQKIENLLTIHTPDVKAVEIVKVDMDHNLFQISARYRQKEKGIHVMLAFSQDLDNTMNFTIRVISNLISKIRGAIAHERTHGEQVSKRDGFDPRGKKAQKNKDNGISYNGSHRYDSEEDYLSDADEIGGHAAQIFHTLKDRGFDVINVLHNPQQWHEVTALLGDYAKLGVNHKATKALMRKIVDMEHAHFS